MNDLIEPYNVLQRLRLKRKHNSTRLNTGKF